MTLHMTTAIRTTGRIALLATLLVFGQSLSAAELSTPVVKGSADAGATKAIVLQLASLTDVNWPMSGEVVLMSLVGGLGTIFGPVVGSFVILLMQYKLSVVGEWVLVIQGIIFVSCVLLFRRGIVGEIAARFKG